MKIYEKNSWKLDYFDNESINKKKRKITKSYEKLTKKRDKKW